MPSFFYSIIAWLLSENRNLYNLHKYLGICKKGLQKGTTYDSKVIHIKKPRKPLKWSYARSYSRYPQKKGLFLGDKNIEKRTTVLWRYHKLRPKLEKNKKRIDILNVKK